MIHPNYISMTKICFTQVKNDPKTSKKLRKIELILQNAKRRKAEIICFGESFPIETNDSTSQKKAIQKMKELSKKYHIAIIAGSTNKLHNQAIFFNHGKIIGSQLKCHFFANERRQMKGQDFRTFKFKNWRIGMLICYDLFFPEPTRYLQEKGADIVFCLTHAFEGQTFWKSLAVVRSMENQLPLVTSGIIERKHKISGIGILALPNSKIVELPRDRETIRVIDVDLGKWNEYRKLKSNLKITPAEYISKGLHGPNIKDINTIFLKKYVAQLIRKIGK